MFTIPEISNEVLTAIIKTIDEGIHVVNTDGVTIFYNDIAAKHDGMDVNEVLGRPLLSVFPSLTNETSTLMKVLKTKHPIEHKTQSYVNFHGHKIETINTTLPLFLHGKLIGAVEIAKDYSQMKQLSERLVQLQSEMKRGKATNKQRVKGTYTFADLMTTNKPFQQMITEAKKLAISHAPILIFGESGTGKELFVQGIHYASLRAQQPFIIQNCAAIPETLLEGILFGTAKGSYTGAIDRPGLFELADGGTLFLDELNSMSIELQAKLLRVLEDGVIRRVGSTKSTTVDVRIIAAMNEHPRQAVERKCLREDLFYRLNVFTFELPSLRERHDDILYLASIFIDAFNEALNKNIDSIEAQVSQLFLDHNWPGNVRELKHTIEYMMNVCEGKILQWTDLPTLLKTKYNERNQQLHNGNSSLSLKHQVNKLEQQLIEKALTMTNGNVKKAAQLLELPRQTLQYKLEKLKLPNYRQ